MYEKAYARDDDYGIAGKRRAQKQPMDRNWRNPLDEEEQNTWGEGGWAGVEGLPGCAEKWTKQGGRTQTLLLRSKKGGEMRANTKKRNQKLTKGFPMLRDVMEKTYGIMISLRSPY